VTVSAAQPVTCSGYQKLSAAQKERLRVLAVYVLRAGHDAIKSRRVTLLVRTEKTSGNHSDV